MLVLVSGPTSRDALEQGGLSDERWWRAVRAAFGRAAMQSYLLIDGIKVAVLALTSPAALPPESLHPLVLKLIRSVHRAVDFLF